MCVWCVVFMAYHVQNMFNFNLMKYIIISIVTLYCWFCRIKICEKFHACEFVVAYFDHLSHRIASHRIASHFISLDTLYDNYNIFPCNLNHFNR